VYSCGWYWDRDHLTAEWRDPDPNVAKILQQLILPHELNANFDEEQKDQRAILANQVIITNYVKKDEYDCSVAGSESGMEAHKDRDDLGPVVYGVTIKGEGHMEFTKGNPRSKGFEKRTISASEGEAYLMTRDSRHSWKHCPFGDRCSITIRAPPWRHPNIEHFDWVYEKCDQEALKQVRKIRHIQDLKDRSARGEKLYKLQEDMVAGESNVAVALLSELVSLPSRVFEMFIQMVTSDGIITAALLPEFESLPFDSESERISERSKRIRDFVTQAADSFANELLVLEARATEGMDSEVAQPLVDHVAQDKAVDDIAQDKTVSTPEEHLSASQRHQRWPRPWGGRNRHM
jgi:hypothetical protein